MQTQAEQLAQRSNYKHGVVHNSELGVILMIKDLDSGMSVTNNIENIITYICELNKCTPSYFNYIIYQDTDKIWDGVIFENGRVIFYFIGCKNIDDTLTFLTDKHNNVRTTK